MAEVADKSAGGLREAGRERCGAWQRETETMGRQRLTLSNIAPAHRKRSRTVNWSFLCVDELCESEVR